jgi:hypothetical protein
MNLRFETDQGEATLSLLKSCLANIQTELSRAKTSANELVPGAWEAPAAFQFQAQFESWEGMVNQSIEQQDALNTKLRYEIDEWIRTAERLS